MEVSAEVSAEISASFAEFSASFAEVSAVHSQKLPRFTRRNLHEISNLEESIPNMFYLLKRCKDFLAEHILTATTMRKNGDLLK